MVLTSIQACGAATTTLARPNPSGASNVSDEFGVRQLLTYQVLAGHAKMREPLRELAHDFGRRKVSDLDAR